MASLTSASIHQQPDFDQRTARIVRDLSDEDAFGINRRKFTAGHDALAGLTLVLLASLVRLTNELSSGPPP